MNSETTALRSNSSGNSTVEKYVENLTNKPSSSSCTSIVAGITLFACGQLCFILICIIVQHFNLSVNQVMFFQSFIGYSLCWMIWYLLKHIKSSPKKNNNKCQFFTCHHFLHAIRANFHWSLLWYGNYKQRKNLWLTGLLHWFFIYFLFIGLQLQIPIGNGIIILHGVSSLLIISYTLTFNTAANANINAHHKKSHSHTSGSVSETQKIGQKSSDADADTNEIGIDIASIPLKHNRTHSDSSTSGSSSSNSDQDSSETSSDGNWNKSEKNMFFSDKTRWLLFVAAIVIQIIGIILIMQPKFLYQIEKKGGTWFEFHINSNIKGGNVIDEIDSNHNIKSLTIGLICILLATIAKSLDSIVISSIQTVNYVRVFVALKQRKHKHKHKRKHKKHGKHRKNSKDRTALEHVQEEDNSLHWLQIELVSTFIAMILLTPLFSLINYLLCVKNWDSNKLNSDHDLLSQMTGGKWHWNVSVILLCVVAGLIGFGGILCSIVGNQMMYADNNNNNNNNYNDKSDSKSYSSNNISTNVATVAVYFDLTFAFFYQVFIFQDTPNFYQIIGIGLLLLVICNIQLLDGYFPKQKKRKIIMRTHEETSNAESCIDLQKSLSTIKESER